MKLPLPLDMEPMLSAISESGIPKGDSWEYEPKWDGFRTLVYRDRDEVALLSRGGRPMTRYFPELLPAFRALSQPKLVLDGELIVVGANGLDFGALQQRVHPAHELDEGDNRQAREEHQQQIAEAGAELAQDDFAVAQVGGQ